MRVLVVESDAMTRQSIEQVLAARGHEVTFASDPETAYEAHAQNPFPLILLDWTPSGTDGILLCRRIRAAPDGNVPVIVFLTSRSGQSDLEAILTAGGDDYLVKPITADALESKLAVIMLRVARRAEFFRATAQVQASEARLAEAERIAHLGSWDWDIAQNQFTWSDELFRIFGVEPGTGPITAARAIACVHPDDRAAFVQRFNRAVREGESFEMEGRVVRPDGTVVDVEARGAPQWNADGGVVRVVGTVQDITERKRTEDALRESEERFRNSFEEAAIGKALVNIDGHFLQVNAAFCETLGYSRSELESMSFQDITHPDDLPIDVENARRLAAGEIRNYQREKRYIHRTGRIVWVLLTVSTLHGRKGEPKYFVSEMENITERKLAEEALRQAQKMEAIGLLAGGVAHDFNNLLTGIIGFTELAIQRLRPNDPARQPLSQVLATCEQAAALTQQLLAFSRRQVTEPTIFNLNDVVTSMQRLLQRLIGDKVALTTQLDPMLAPVQADVSQIEQVILNLAINARDAMPDGGRLVIATRNVDVTAVQADGEATLRPGHYASLQVTDTGVGMSPDVLQRIFEPFFTTKPVGEGTGLGLATVYGVVQQSGGAISVESEPGAGTTFRIYLPASAEPRTRAQEAARGYAPGRIRDHPCDRRRRASAGNGTLGPHRVRISSDRGSDGRGRHAPVRERARTYSSGTYGCRHASHRQSRARRAAPGTKPWTSRPLYVGIRP